jgi:hypothetical protein
VNVKRNAINNLRSEWSLSAIKPLHGNGAKNAPRERTSTMSAEGRAKISAAAKERWAKRKK